MATTFSLFNLGIAPVIDTVEGNNTSENHNALNGLVFGGFDDPLAFSLQTLSPSATNGFASGGNTLAYDANNALYNEQFLINGETRIHDATMLYANSIITYTDGTTATVQAIVMQDTDGTLYLLPPASGPNAYSDALTAKPIASLTLGTANPANGTDTYGMAADRFELDIPNYLVEGTSGGDLIDASYTGDPQGDRVDNSDNIDGSNDDIIYAYGGDDTVIAGQGDDLVYGGDGNDLLYGGTGSDTLYGDSGSDVLDGGDGDDLLFGGAGDDVVFGGDGNDTIYGDSPEMPGTWSYEVWNYDFTAANGQAFDAENGTRIATGTTEGFDSSNLVLDARNTTGDPDDFAVIYRSTLAPSESGTFTFSTTSDDGSTIRIFDPDGNLLVWTNQDGTTATYLDNDYHQGATTRTGEVTLQEGVSYTIEVRHWENAGAEVISGTVTSPSGVTEDLANSDMIRGPDVADAGDDLLVGGAGDDVIFGGFGNDTIAGGDGNDTLFGGDGDDVITGGDGDDVIYGGAGDDTLYGGAGDTIYGGDGADVIVLDPTALDSTGQTSAAITVDGGSGGADNDTLDLTNYLAYRNLTQTVDPDGNSTSGSVEMLDLNENWVTVNFTEIENLLLPSDGIVAGTSGDDTIDGSYTGDPDGDVVDGGDGVLPGAGPDDDLIYGFEGNDFINSGVGNDLVFGGTGNDTISSTSGDSTLYGDEGNDLIQVESGDNIVYGGEGNDTIFAGLGNDSILGGTGDDVIYVQGGGGSDTIIGGEDPDGLDTDTLNFSQGTSGTGTDVVLTGDEEGTYSYAGGGSGEFSEIEEFSLTSLDDTFDASATSGGATVDGGAGNDTLIGSGGADYLEGGDGDDSIDGGAGDDELFGGAGDDTLRGGTGQDTLDGGAGDDLIFIAEGDQALGGDGNDTFVLEDLAESGTGTINIVGGDGGETEGGGDTLQLGTLSDWSTLVQTSEGINESGNESFSGSVTLDNGTILTFSGIENIICFTPGTRIATSQGLVAVEDLKLGDLVVTRDHGLQPIRWIEGRIVPAIDRFAPVRIRNGVLAGQERDLIVSPQHRVLFQGYRAELLFGESEVLVSATHLVDGCDVTQEAGGVVTYIHMLFDQHEIIFAEGAATESFHPGDVGFSAVGDAARDELFDLFPTLRADPSAYGATARRCLKSHEAELILS